VDYEDLRTRQQECLALVAPSTLKSITAILSAAESWAKADRGTEVLSWLGRWIRDLVLVHVGGDHDQLLHLDQVVHLEQAATQADLRLLLDLLNDLERTEQQATRHFNLQMTLETSLLRLRDALGFASAAAPA
jgi:DNA polymerase-3 subunit delta'